jgi:hypothetical protein
MLFSWTLATSETMSITLVTPLSPRSPRPLPRSYKAQPRALALVHLALGERYAAIEWLKKACDQRPFGANYLKSDPVWDDLRPDPRFTALLARLKL